MEAPSAFFYFVRSFQIIDEYFALLTEERFLLKNKTKKKRTTPLWNTKLIGIFHWFPSIVMELIVFFFFCFPILRLPRAVGRIRNRQIWWTTLSSTVIDQREALRRWPPPSPFPRFLFGQKKKEKDKKRKKNPFAPSFSLISFAFSLSLSLCVSFVAGKQRTNNSPIFFSNNPFYLFYYSIDFLFRFFFLSSREVSCAFFSCFFFLFLFFLFLFFLFFFPVALEEFPHKMFRQFKVEKGVGLG